MYIALHYGTSLYYLFIVIFLLKLTVFFVFVFTVGQLHSHKEIFQFQSVQPANPQMQDWTQLRSSEPG